MSEPRSTQPSSRKTTLAALRRFAIARSLFAPTTLQKAVRRLGFVQADPIRAPARAQDLTLRPRVRGYRAGDLDQQYGALGLEEDIFINYGFLPGDKHALMHPRPIPARGWNRERVEALLELVREKGELHPREAEARFAHGKVTNAWGGKSSATTHLLDAMHYRGLLRVVRRENGIRVYGVKEHPPLSSTPAERLDALVDLVVGKYAPVPAARLSNLVSRLQYAAPQWAAERRAAFARAKQRLARARVDGIDWYWPADERLGGEPLEEVRLLAPFDPVVWDRRRFELFWGWAYRFEAYTPVKKRKLGYYALPLLWHDEVIGWGNLSSSDGGLSAQLGYLSGAAPKEPAFKRELDAELARIDRFLVMG